LISVSNVNLGLGTGSTSGSGGSVGSVRSISACAVSCIGDVSSGVLRHIAFSHGSVCSVDSSICVVGALGSISSIANAWAGEVSS
jgi:hypothetical protein